LLRPARFRLFALYISGMSIIAFLLLDRSEEICYVFIQRLMNEVGSLSNSPSNMRQEQAAETRRKLLAAALTLFAKKGYSSTPVREINRSIGMADGLLYHYFPGGKKEMLRVMVHENLQQVFESLKNRNSGIDTLPIEEMLEHVFKNIEDVLSAHQEILKIVIRESEIIEMLELKQLVASVRQRQSRLPSILEARAKAGEICEMDYESAAGVIMAVMMNHLLSRLTGVGSGQLSDPEKRQRLIRYQVALWKNPQV